MAEDKEKDKPTKGTKQKPKETWSLSEVMPLNLEDIDPEDKGLQSRCPDAKMRGEKALDKYEEAEQIKALVKELENLRANHKDYRKQHLDPIVVFHELNSNNKWRIVSGFHRTKAYLAFNKKQRLDKERKKTIPCKIFTGTAVEAFTYSSGQDIKPVRSKRQSDKANAAWKLVHGDSTEINKMTHGELAEKTGISKSLVRTMREVLKAVNAEKVHYYDNWKVQQCAYKSKQEAGRKLSEEELRRNEIESRASQLYNKVFVDAYKRDASLFKEVIMAVLSRMKTESEEDAYLLELLEDNKPQVIPNEEDEDW